MLVTYISLQSSNLKYSDMNQTKSILFG